MEPKKAANLLRIVAWANLIAGVAISLGVVPALSGGMDVFLTTIIPGSEGMASIVSTEGRMMTAIAGGVLAGLAAMMIWIVAPAMDRGNRDVARAATMALTIWFVVDGAGSALAGAPMNIVGNAVIFTAFLIPLLGMKQPAAA